MSFRGLHTINMDAKGRLAMPTRVRTIIEGRYEHTRLVVTIDQAGESLVIYPLKEFNEIERKVESLSSFKRSTVRLKRLIIGHAQDVDIDGSGRILIPPTLRSYAGLEKKVVLVGQGKKLELWNEDRWDIQREIMLKEANEENENELPEELQNLSL